MAEDQVKPTTEPTPAPAATPAPRAKAAPPAPIPETESLEAAKPAVKPAEVKKADTPEKAVKPEKPEKADKEPKEAKEAKEAKEEKKEKPINVIVNIKVDEEQLKREAEAYYPYKKKMATDEY